MSYAEYKVIDKGMDNIKKNPEENDVIESFTNIFNPACVTGASKLYNDISFKIGLPILIILMLYLVLNEWKNKKHVLKVIVIVIIFFLSCQWVSSSLCEYHMAPILILNNTTQLNLETPDDNIELDFSNSNSELNNLTEEISKNTNYEMILNKETNPVKVYIKPIEQTQYTITFQFDNSEKTLKNKDNKLKYGNKNDDNDNNNIDIETIHISAYIKNTTENRFFIQGIGYFTGAILLLCLCLLSCQHEAIFKEVNIHDFINELDKIRVAFTDIPIIGTSLFGPSVNVAANKDKVTTDIIDNKNNTIKLKRLLIKYVISIVWILFVSMNLNHVSQNGYFNMGFPMFMIIIGFILIKNNTLESICSSTFGNTFSLKNKCGFTEDNNNKFISIFLKNKKTNIISLLLAIGFLISGFV